MEPPTRTTCEDEVQFCGGWNDVLHFTHVIDLVFLDTRVLKDLLDRLHGLSEKVHVELLELGSSQSLHDHTLVGDVTAYKLELTSEKSLPPSKASISILVLI